MLDPESTSGGSEPALRQDRAIAFHVALTGLRGLTYPIRGLRRDAPLTGATYADWGRFELKPGGGPEQITEPRGRSPLDFALGSAASPGGFAPQLLDRREDEGGYRSRGVDNFPESGHLWYTDGGLVASQPIGRTVAAGRSLHGPDTGAHHVNLLIDPRSEVSSGSDQWSDPDGEASWQDGLSRALGVLSQQELFEDLRRIEKDNSRLEWADELAEALTPHLDDEAGPALREFLERVESARDEMRADEPHREDERGADDDADLATVLREALAEVGGLTGKQPLSCDVISPLLLQDTEDEADVESLLAGEFMGDFGGFLSRELRESDFALGYESALVWLRRGLGHCGVEDEAIARTVAAVEEHRAEDPDEVHSGDASLGDLSLRDRFQLVRLGLHTARVLGSAALAERARIPDAVGKAIGGVRERAAGLRR